MKLAVLGGLLLAIGLTASQRVTRPSVAVLAHVAEDSARVRLTWRVLSGAERVVGWRVSVRAAGWAAGDSIAPAIRTDTLTMPKDTVAVAASACVHAMVTSAPFPAEVCTAVTIPAKPKPPPPPPPPPEDVVVDSLTADVLPDSAPPPPPPPGDDIVPAALRATMGPLVPRAGTDPVLRTLDSLYLAWEQRHFRAYASNPTDDNLVGQATHYDALRSRLQWALRNGQPYGPGVTDTAASVYARGRYVLLAYLDWARRIGYNIGGQGATSLAGVEALYLLEGVPEARTALQAAAQPGTWKDAWGYYNMTDDGSDPRQVAAKLQAMGAAHRLGIPFAAYNAERGFNNVRADSWRDAGEKMYTAVIAGGNVHADGTVNSPGHKSTGQCGAAPVCEAYFMNAMLATELLRWHGHVASNAAMYATARAIVDHLIAEHARHGLPSLPYLSGDTDAAPDLAGFYVWPALVLWQDTGDASYRAFAEANLRAARGAYSAGAKQLNQTFATGLQSAEALIGGRAWR